MTCPVCPCRGKVGVHQQRGKKMNQQEIRKTIAALARSQGSWGRLLERLDANPEAYEQLEQMGFNDPLDLIMALEG